MVLRLPEFSTRPGCWTREELEELVELWDSVSDLRSENKFVPPGDLVAIDPVSPLGGELEYVDGGTLSHAFYGRRVLE